MNHATIACRRERTNPPSTPARPGQISERVAVDGRRRQLEQLPLDQFATAGLALRVYSEVLGEDVIFASDNAEICEHPDLPVYRADELRQLLKLRSPDLQALHASKKSCDKAIVAA